MSLPIYKIERQVVGVFNSKRHHLWHTINTTCLAKKVEKIQNKTKNELSTNRPLGPAADIASLARIRDVESSYQNWLSCCKSKKKYSFEYLYAFKWGMENQLPTYSRTQLLATRCTPEWDCVAGFDAHSVSPPAPIYQPARLQSILRAAARLVLQLPGWASVSNLMRVQLYWLSIPQRIQFKLCSVVYRCLYNMAPIYLRDLCMSISSLEGQSHLRSAAAGDLRIPSAKTVTIGRHGFSIAGPAAWNNLSTTLKDYELTFSAFKKLLKTELFKSM